MSVCSMCIKTTADSIEKYDKTLFVDISDSYIEYNIFDTDKSVVDSNYLQQDDISLKFSKIKINNNNND